MATKNFVIEASRKIIEAITELNKAEFIAAISGEVELSYAIAEQSAELLSLINSATGLQSEYKAVLLTPRQTIGADDE